MKLKTLRKTNIRTEVFLFELKFMNHDKSIRPLILCKVLFEINEFIKVFTAFFLG